MAEMTDLELAREWLHERPLINEVSYVTAESLVVLLSRVRSDEAAKYPHPASIRLDEAKWWREWYNQEDNSSQYEHDRAVERIRTLEQAAGGSAAAGSEK